MVTALRPENGQTIWQEGYAAPYTMNPAATTHGKGVKSTPVVADGRIFTFGINGTLSCFDAKTGKPQWRKEFGSPDFGVATSPLVDHGLVIVHVGGNDAGRADGLRCRDRRGKMELERRRAGLCIAHHGGDRRHPPSGHPKPRQYRGGLGRDRRTALADSFQDSL